MTRKRPIRLSVSAQTANLLNNQSSRIWAYCRKHRDSLDSEQHCKAIRSVMDGIVSVMREQIDSITADLKKARKELSALRKFAAQVRREERER